MERLGTIQAPDFLAELPLADSGVLPLIRLRAGHLQPCMQTQLLIVVMGCSNLAQGMLSRARFETCRPSHL